MFSRIIASLITREIVFDKSEVTFQFQKFASKFHVIQKLTAVSTEKLPGGHKFSECANCCRFSLLWTFTLI